MSGGLAGSFLEDIVAHIDDDTPRLVFADWLAENGHDDRAEFIRVQIERARLPAWDPAQVRLRLREQELLEQHGEQWLAELPVIEGARWEGFRRGIVAEVSFASFEAMRQSAHACRAVAPIVAVTVRWPRRKEAGQAGTPIAELRELSLTGRPSAEDEVGWLADSPQLSTLRSLTARGLWAEGLGRLVASPHLAGLKAFHLPSNELGIASIPILTRAASLTSLEEITLSSQPFQNYRVDSSAQAAGVEALAGWAGLASVRSLRLSGNDLNGTDLRALLRSPHVGALEELFLPSNFFDGEEMAEFAAARPELRLEVLDLGENLLKEQGVEYLAMAPCLRDLKVLWLDRNEIWLAGARLLAEKASFLDGLRLLDVSQNHFGPAGLEALLERQPPSLHTLVMRDNELLDKGAALLAGSPASDGLLEVDLSRNRLGAAATLALGESAHLRGLLVLRLGDNPINEQAAAALTASPLGQRLAVLELQDAPPTSDPDHDGQENLAPPPSLPPAPGLPPVGGDDDIPF
jgi:uncharacterized protein (TIGR02996 family)